MGEACDCTDCAYVMVRASSSKEEVGPKDHAV